MKILDNCAAPLRYFSLFARSFGHENASGFAGDMRSYGKTLLREAVDGFALVSG